MWPQIAAFVCGVWLTASPDILGFEDPARMIAHVVGPLAATVALIAVFEVTRPFRWLNVPLGAFLTAAPWVLGYPPAEAVNTATIGVGLVVLACVRGRLTETFGGGWRALVKPPAHSMGASE